MFPAAAADFSRTLLDSQRSLMLPDAAADLSWTLPNAAGLKPALWIVSHFLLIAFNIELESFKNGATLFKAIAEKEMLTGLHTRTWSTSGISARLSLFPVSSGLSTSHLYLVMAGKIYSNSPFKR